LLDEELSSLLSEVISGILEALLETAVNLFNSFLFTALLELIEALGHLLADLLRRFKVGHEFLFIHAVFSIQESLESIIFYYKMAVIRDDFKAYLSLRSSRFDS
jgi:hypothetical protein